MSKNNVVSLNAHDQFADLPVELAHEGSRRILALEAEVGEFVVHHDKVK